MKTASTENDSKKSWMIIDTDEDRLLLLHDIFSRFAEVKVEYFNFPDDAITAFETEPETFEFVITDLDLSESTNFELLCRLRLLTPVLNVLLPVGIDLLSNEEAEEKGFCRPLPRRLPFAALQQALSPAILRYKETPDGLPGGLTLLHAA